MDYNTAGKCTPTRALTPVGFPVPGLSHKWDCMHTIGGSSHDDILAASRIDQHAAHGPFGLIARDNSMYTSDCKPVPDRFPNLLIAVISGYLPIFPVFGVNFATYGSNLVNS